MKVRVGKGWGNSVLQLVDRGGNEEGISIIVL